MRKKHFIFFTFSLVCILAAVIVFFGGFGLKLIPSNSGPIADKISTVPIDENLLGLSIRINEASTSLHRKIKEANLNLPPVELFDSDFSYKTPGRRMSWIVTNRDNSLITIVIYRDVLAPLNSDEIQAFALHDLCHLVLGHLDDNPLTRKPRNVQMEKDADKCAVDSGINPKVMVSTINKLVPDSDWRVQRLNALIGPDK